MKDDAGAPLVAVPLQRALRLHRSWDATKVSGLSDASGNSTITMPLAATDDSVSVAITGRTTLGQRTQAQAAEEVARWRTAVGQYSFLQSYRAKVVGGATTASMDISVRHAVKTTFLLTINGQPAKGEIDYADIVGFLTEMQPVVQRDRFVMHGVPKGVACEVCVQYDGQFQFNPVAAQSSDAELAAINVDRASSTVSFNASLQRAADVPRADGSGKGGMIGITLLKSDGSGGYVLGRADLQGDPDPGAKSKFIGLNAFGVGPTLTIKPGEYWVLPGYWANLDAQVAFRQQLKAGRDVSASGLPHFTAVAGQPVALTLDGDAMVNSYEQFTKILVEGAMPILGPDVPNYVPALPPPNP